MTDWPEIPENVVEGVRERWPDRADRWLATAGETLAELCAGYNGRPRDALHARYGYVVSVDTPDGGLVIRSSPDPDGPIQTKVSEALAALGVAPAIHQILLTDIATWTVMDEIQPGMPFALTDRKAADLEALAAPLANLRSQPTPVPGMPSLIDWLRVRLEDDDLKDMPIWREPATPAERIEALRLLADLEEGFKPLLCHGDASTWNLLLSGQDRWTLIDPRGVTGEVHYDLAVLATKVRGDLAEKEVARRFAAAAEVDVARVHAWMTVATAARV
ncbi:aminoglycoside phosphotransferase family protein [Dactylosporangium sp. NPDC000555]|uniref:aminoglycoside phosphotransferase family protein n=1 Tax=Dactylosporangium sp. NPDC000555 TaxID=3154260 RepID=UPI00331C20AD